MNEELPNSHPAFTAFEQLEGCSQCHGTGILLNQSYSGAPWAPGCIPVQACDECSVHPSDVAAVTALVEANRKMRRLTTRSQRADAPAELFIGWNGWYGPEGDVSGFPDGDVWVTTDRENAGPMEPEGMEP